MRITTKQIDAIVPFLEPFETKGFEFATWNPPRSEDGAPVIAFGNMWQLSEQAQEFIEALNQNGWIANFDWPSWQDQAIQYVKSPERIASADLETIRKLLTTNVRKDRFCEGHLAAMFENGHISAMLRRLKDIRATMPHIQPKIRELQHDEHHKGEEKPDKHRPVVNEESGACQQQRLFEDGTT